MRLLNQSPRRQTQAGAVTWTSLKWASRTAGVSA
jgi:hypothetical protein